MATKRTDAPSIGGLDTGDGPVPARVVELAAGRPVRAVWRNELGGTTYRLGDDLHVKWVPSGVVGLDLPAEIARLAWAAPHASVPRVVGHGDDEAGSWLVTTTLPGSSAVDPRWHDDPRPAVVAAGEGLRALHESLPVLDCPFEWSTASRIAAARNTAARNTAARDTAAEGTASVDEAVAAMGLEPEPDRIVVCHGDPCTPNTIVADDGTWVGHVDLDALGIADRWADIAVGTMALGWNFGPGWERLYLDAYGIAADDDRTAWYRALWNLGGDEPAQQPGR
jgi:kanamycin kinase